MKRTILIVILLFLLFGGVGYFGMKILIEKDTAILRSDVQDLKMRLQKIEEESKLAPLQPDADVQKVIKTVNAIYHKVNSLEGSFNKGMSQTGEEIKRQGKATEEAMKKQAEAIDKINKETKAITQNIMFDAVMANIRGHILKARVELLAKNVGTARAELDLIEELFSKAAASASEENKKAIEELRTALKKARAEIDTDLPAAVHRIDLLWHEMSKLIRKG
jgi:hypothetical protein